MKKFLLSYIMMLSISFSAFSQKNVAQSTPNTEPPKEEKKSKEFKQAMDAFKSNEFFLLLNYLKSILQNKEQKRKQRFSTTSD